MPSRPLSVLVSGAGIAGATLACLLGRQGHQVTVVERDQGVRSSGKPVDVRAGAFDVAERLGLLPRLREVATKVRTVVFVDDAGRPVASMATRRSDRELEVDRGDLCAALVEQATQAADIRFDDAVARIESDATGVEVTFDRSAPGRFDLVVGADGLHSAVRRLAFGPEADFVEHLGMYIATVRLASAPERDDVVLVHNVPGAATAVHPAAGRPGAAFIFRSRKRVSPRDRAAVEELLTTTYGTGRWRSAELLAAYLAAEDTYFDAVSRVRTPTWSRGRVTLLGDAASCVSLFGEGSSSAIGGANTLAEALEEAPDDLSAALTHYESRQRRSVRRGQSAAPLAAHLLVPASATGLSLRNRALRLTGHR